MNDDHTNLYLRFLDRSVTIVCPSGMMADLLRANFEGMLTHAQSSDLTYVIDQVDDGRFKLSRTDSDFAVVAAHTGEVIYELEGNLVVWLQLEHRSYAFLHAAALVCNGAIHILTGHSGAGKSTTAFGLTHFGFQLATDEMVAFDLASGNLIPFRHAICLKQMPPDDFRLPPGTVRSGRGFHIPPTALGKPVDLTGLTVASIFFVEHDPNLTAPAITQCSAGEAITRLYPNMMNALAHGNSGLGAAANITRQSSNFIVRTARLGESCELIRQTLDEVAD